jgi:hypothetical protein
MSLHGRDVDVQYRAIHLNANPTAVSFNPVMSNTDTDKASNSMVISVVAIMPRLNKRIWV